jgi:hypothetical protein
MGTLPRGKQGLAATAEVVAAIGMAAGTVERLPAGEARGLGAEVPCPPFTAEITKLKLEDQTGN